MPLTVRNPLTNEIIVGEVEFYLLGNSQASRVNGRISDESEEVTLKAEYIGTDYNYALSQEFRQNFAENSLEGE